MSTPQQPNGQPNPNQPYVPEGYELSKKKKPWYQRLGCLIPLAIVVIIIVAIAVSTGGSDDDSDTGNSGDTNTTAPAEPGSENSDEEDNGVPTEHRSALRSAERYIQSGNFSQDGLYRQLTSDFDQFSAESAQYAVDNIDADWNQEALDAAQSYQDSMSMSPAAIYDQLTSDIEGYTPEQAQYAVDNLS